MCLTVDSDPLGDSGRGARQTQPLLSLPQLSSQRSEGSVGVGSWGGNSIRWPLIPAWGGGRRGHLGLRLGMWMKTAVFCSTPRTNL